MEIAADALRLPPWDAVIAKLSGGEKRRVALCKLLLSKPDMLLLDEPTNHLDAESVDWLEQFLSRFPGTVVAVTHDRYFLDNAAEWILELDRGMGIPWKGNYSSWLEQKEERLEREAKTVSSLNHPNICTLFDVGREGDTDYLVMELVDGETLAQHVGAHRARGRAVFGPPELAHASLIVGLHRGEKLRDRLVHRLRYRRSGDRTLAACGTGEQRQAEREPSLHDCTPEVRTNRR